MVKINQSFFGKDFLTTDRPNIHRKEIKEDLVKRNAVFKTNHEVDAIKDYFSTINYSESIKKKVHNGGKITETKTITDKQLDKMTINALGVDELKSTNEVLLKDVLKLMNSSFATRFNNGMPKEADILNLNINDGYSIGNHFYPINQLKEAVQFLDNPNSSTSFNAKV